MKTTLNSLLISLAALSGCAVHNNVPNKFEMPYRAPIAKVEVKTVSPDGVCPGGAYLYMDSKNFKNLQSNIIDSELYIQQLENLLKSLQ